jgi:hypothetical protein
MGNEEKPKKLTFEHSGDHHQAVISIDPDTKQVIGGVVHNFSENSAVGLSLNKDGKVTGTIVHSGDTHAFRADIRNDGSFEGVYADKQKGVEIALSGSEAELKKGSIPEAGITVDGDHHSTSLRVDKNGKISGAIESKNTKNGAFRLEIQDGKAGRKSR